MSIKKSLGLIVGVVGEGWGKGDEWENGGCQNWMWRLYRKNNNWGNNKMLDIFIKNIIFILILIYVNWGNQLSLNVRYVDC